MVIVGVELSEESAGESVGGEIPEEFAVVHVARWSTSAVIMSRSVVYS
jgi:hypothetical protein